MIFVIFDIDGTLVHSDKLDSQCFADAYEVTFERKFPSIDWRDYPHVSDDTIFGTVFNNHFSRVATDVEKLKFQDHFVEKIKTERVRRPNDFYEVPGAKKLLEILGADDRYQVGIATGGWRAPARVKLDYVGINAELLPAGYADGHPTRPDIIRTAIHKMKVQHGEPTKIVYVGDAIWDLTTCREMDIPLIGIRIRGDLDFFTERGVEFVFSDYKDEKAFLRAVNTLSAQ